MNARYMGKSGEVYYVSETAIASGGEGVIYDIQNHPSQVAKIFKEDRRTPEREEKLCLMVEYHLNQEQLSQITWPQDVLYENGQFVGYVMPRLANNKNLNVLFATEHSQINFRHRLLVAYNICAAVDTIHQLGQVCGDLNPQNICVNLELTSSKALQVTLVDTDSYHITKDSRTYRCEVGLSNYIAPEVQEKMSHGQSLRTAPLPTYTRETDLFALAVHVFTLLMNGSHPFACAQDTGNGYQNDMQQMNAKVYESVVLPQPIDNIRNGFFPFHQKREGITYPLYAPAFSSLPMSLQNLFIRTFEEGHKDPTKRATATEWMQAIRELSSNQCFAKCEKEHHYFSYAGECPFCAIGLRMQKLLRKPEPAPVIPPSSGGNGGGQTVWSGGQGTTGGQGGSGKTVTIHTPPAESIWDKYAPGIVVVVLAVILCIAVAVSAPEPGTTVVAPFDEMVDYGTEESADEQPPQSPEELYDACIAQAGSCMEAKDYVGVEAACIQAQGILPNRPEAYVQLAKVQEMKGNLKKAKSILNEGRDVCDEDAYYDAYSAMEEYRDDILDKIEQEKLDAKNLKIGKKILTAMKNKNYKKAANLADTYCLEDDLRNKIYIQKGKLVKTIKSGYGFRYDAGSYPSQVYLGYFKDGKPSGKGTEVGKAGYVRDNGSSGYYKLSGQFKNGYANGHCTLYYSQCKFSDGEKYSQTVSGNYRNGREDGDMTMTVNYYSGKKTQTYYYHSDNGTQRIIRVEGGRYLYAETKSGDWYISYDDRSSAKNHGAPRRKKK